MEEYETIIASVEEGVGKLTINRPDSRNSLNTQVLGDIRQALAEFRHHESVGVVVFTGSGDRAFAAGPERLNPTAAKRSNKTGRSPPTASSCSSPMASIRRATCRPIKARCVRRKSWMR